MTGAKEWFKEAIACIVLWGTMYAFLSVVEIFNK